MFVTTPEIVWHNKEPVFSIDFHRNGGMCRLASAGSDFSVKVRLDFVVTCDYRLLISYGGWWVEMRGCRWCLWLV